MGADNKVVWSEGMFLRPQHFQQHDRYLEKLVRNRVAGIRPCAYGISELKINRELLGSGKFAVVQCRGVLPDGTPFDILSDGNHPVPMEIGPNVRNETLYLTLPEQQPGQTETTTASNDSLAARFAASTYRSFDSVAGSDTSADVEIGKLRLRYALESSERAGYVCLGLARIIEVRPDKAIVLDERYIPPTLSCAAVGTLKGFIDEVKGRLHQLGDELAGRLAGGGGEVGNLLRLQIANRYEPLLSHYASLAELHPETLFATLIQLAGEMATLASQSKRTSIFPEYRHDDLQQTFAPVMVELRRQGSTVAADTAVQIPILERQFGIKVAVLEDKKMLADATFILTAKADVQPESLRQNFPRQFTVGPVEQISRLVNSGSQGIRVRALPVAPREMPFHAGTLYFELDRTNPLWRELATSGGFAFFVGGDFPGLAMEFWAIRK